MRRQKIRRAITRLVVEQPAILTSVGAGRVQAQQRNAGPGLLEINPVILILDAQMHITADDRFNAREQNRDLP